MDLLKLFKIKEKPIVPNKETAWAKDSLFQTIGPFLPYQADELVAKKGLDVYDKMMLDPQVQSCLTLYYDLITSQNYTFSLDGEDPTQEEIKDFFEHNLNFILRGTWPQIVRNILTAKAYGFSVCEKIYAVEQYEGKDKLFLKDLKLRPWNSFTFVYDDFGNFTDLLQTQGETQKKLDPNKFVIYINRPEISPEYGLSALRAAYDSYWAKSIIKKFWNIHIERLAGGFTVVTPTENAANLSEIERNNLQNSLKNLNTLTAMISPQGYDVSVVQAQDTQAFAAALDFHNKEIAKSLSIPNMLGYSEQGATGSFAQSKIQQDTFFKTLKFETDKIADVLNENIFKELALKNFGVDKYPLMVFDPISDEEKIARAKAWGEAVSQKLVLNTEVDENKTRGFLGYDLRDMDVDPKLAVPEPAENPNSQDPSSQGLGNSSAAQNGTEGAAYSANGAAGGEPTWESRVNFVGAKTTLDLNESNLVSELSEAVESYFNDISQDLSNIINSKDPLSYINRDVFYYDDKIERIADLVKKNIRNSYLESERQAMLELQTAMRSSNSQFIDKLPAIFSHVPTGCLAKKWSVLNFAQGLDLQTAEAYFEAKAFQIAGDLTDDMISAVKQLLLDGIKNDKSYEEITTAIEQYLGSQGIIGGVDKTENKPFTRSMIETIARTNIADAFNQARLSVYNNPKLENFVQALEYSAILDSRTTLFCQSYNGKIYRRTDPIWNSITPPNHFNCRSILIPVTELDTYTLSSPLPLQPAKGF